MAEESVAGVLKAHADAQKAIIDSSLARLTHTRDNVTNPIMAGDELIGDEQASNAPSPIPQQQRFNHHQAQPAPQRGFGAILRRFSRSSDTAALEADGASDASAAGSAAGGSSLGL